MLGSTLNAVKKQIKATPRSQSASHEIMDMINEVSLSSRAPSIPSRGRCFGYEVGATGKLIPQESSLAGHKGTKGDTVGPGITILTMYTQQRTRSHLAFRYYLITLHRTCQ